MSLESIPMQSVESSNIKAIGYDAFTRTLKIEFRKGGGLYHNVSAEDWDGFQQAASKGKFLNEVIKNKYGYERL